ncbi:hypothetical protein [Gordonia sp. CPCC 205333]|uniref:hypothetical protein n=1 Tax=Gordonia sp. CPCC 205333 TaxID=3140790 RepID=UPI003AF3C90D
MRRSIIRSIVTGIAIAGVTATAFTCGNSASAAGRGITLTAVDSANCTATFTLTNYTNSSYFQPDWWFEQEANDTWINAGASDTGLPVTAPWRYTSGVPWPIARWVGNPALHSELAAGVTHWGSGVPYNSAAQPDGFVSTTTVNLKTVENPAPPAASASGTQTIYFRVKTGPQTADRLPNPVKLVVTGCKSKPHGNGSLDWGSSSGSLGGM